MVELSNLTPDLYRDTITLREAYETCKEISNNHYENFTVVSRLLPASKRKYVYALYAFSRYTDDLGDELEKANLQALNKWEEELKAAFEDKEPGNEIMVALQDTVKKNSLPFEPFSKLIEANRMDQKKNSYSTYEELLKYCDHSANPVGRIFLEIFGYRDEERKKLSDKTCTGLQLTNFWQDVNRDEDMGRVYIPLEDMEKFGYSRQELKNRVYNERFVSLMEFEVERARGLLREGTKLASLLDRRISMDVRLFNEGGIRILDKIEQQGYDVLTSRPTLSRGEKVWLFLSNLIKRPFRRLLDEKAA